MFSSGSSTIMFGAMLMTSQAGAHMIMKTPVPYSQDTLNNSPLDASGSDFPCKLRTNTFDVTKMNNMKVGDTQQLSFTGSATHGGGSCQLSVTLDKAPAKDSKFKVIYSIEGGCPASTAGNLGDDPNGDGASVFPFTMPKEVPNGEATLAWTWFNKVGNREMYMNCAPITVSGGASDSSAFDKLPDMAVANLASEGSCHTPESSDYIFANPGQYVTKNGTGPYANLCGGAAAAPGGSAGSQAATLPATGAPSATMNPGIPDQATPTAAAPSAPAASSGGSGAVPSVSAPAMPTSTVTTLLTVTGTPPDASSASDAPVASSAPVAAHSAAPSAAPSAPVANPSSPSSGGGSSGTCITEGSIVCNGEDQFGICNFGKVDFQPVAAGTKCDNGAIAKRFVHRARRSV